jgi:type I restriction enzyme S subunit
MNPETFFDKFGLLADTPNGMQKLRELILQLAVQGKLVPQDSNDEPASVLLEGIRAEKERLVREKNIKKPKQLPVIGLGEIPYNLPNNWRWVRLGEIVNYNGAIKVSSSDIPEDAWLLGLEDIEKDTSRIIQHITFKDRISKSTKTKFEKEDVLYGKLRPYLNKVVVADADGFCTTEIVPLKGYFGLFPKYLMYALKRPEFLEYVSSRTYGINLPRIGTEDARRALIPLPPLHEQKRIVAKVDQLMALCDELEAQQQKKQEARLHLNSAALDKLLTAHEPDEFAHHWQRICDNFDLLYGRKAILQLAVQGKLVRQDANDEPAAVLLERIKAEKERLVKEKKIKVAKALLPIKGDEWPYELPKEWKLARLGELVESMTNGIYKPSKYYSDNGIACLRMYNIQRGKINYLNLKRMLLEDDEIERYRLVSGDLLVNRVNSRELVGKAGVINLFEESLIFESKNIRVRFIICEELPEYINILFQTREVREVFEGDAKQTCGQASISQPQVAGIITPLPPLNEQKRIVARVDQLMALCDELEVKIEQSQTDGEKLMEAVVGELIGA